MNLQELFPKSEFRPGQREVIERIIGAFESGKRFVTYDGPCGAGKSVIAYTVAKHFLLNGGWSFYLTSTKPLQSQLADDFADVVDLKGRNSYKCDYWKMKHEKAGGLEKETFRERAHTYHDCASGECKRQGLSKLRECFTEDGTICKYFDRLREATRTPICTMNYKCFLFQMMAHTFDSRTFMICDEGHSVESELMDFVGMTLSDRLLGSVKFDDRGSVAEYQKMFREIGLGEIIDSEKANAFYAQDLRRYEELEQMVTKYKRFNSEDPNEWVYKLSKSRDEKYVTLEFKPIFISKFANDLLFKANHVLLMSATLIDAKQLTSSLGIDKDDCVSLRSANRFPKGNRPIYKRFAGSMNYKDKASTMPKLVKKVDSICRHYPECRGIIHTHTFEITNRLLSDCAPDVSSRFLFQKNFRTKEDMLKEHATRKNSIIVAPAMHEGIDLRDDLSRFQIVCKVPYPNYKDDPQLAKRMELNGDYLSYLTALKLVQCVGRSVRSEKDWADTYVLDAEFDRFLNRNSRLLPPWFVEAVR